MKKELLTMRERAMEIVERSCEIFQAKIVNNYFGEIANEASMQLQLGIILQQIGKLYEWGKNDHFNVIFENPFELSKATNKSPNKKARCDIYIEMYEEENKHCRVGIELKYFPKCKDEATTDNRIAILEDIENIEQYIKDDWIDFGYSYVYTTNENYARSDTRSSINLGNGVEVHGGKCKSETVELTGTYVPHWQEYCPNNDNSNTGKSFFLLLQVNEKDVCSSGQNIIIN
jgi:hypothetical protein